MENLLLICVTAFAAVLVVLSALAVAIWLLGVAFPARQPRTDAAVIAAIQAGVAQRYPGARLTRVEEIRRSRDPRT
jgi:LPS O-antigen subunit length determinant protein (WzzB/FepE family)